MNAIESTREYYADLDVQEREYCGATTEHGPTCTLVSELAPGGQVTCANAPRFSNEALPELSARGWDISRSLADHPSLPVYFAIAPRRGFARSWEILRKVRTIARRLTANSMPPSANRDAHTHASWHAIRPLERDAWRR